MLTFPKSIADPTAAPVATFTSNRTQAVGKKADGSTAADFATALKSAKSTTTSAVVPASDSLGLDNQNSEDKFLTLLVAQMRNQDPLNPLDNAQVTSQLAQINTVRGIEKLNTSMGTLIQNLGASDALQNAELIGRRVLVAGDGLRIGEDAQSSSLGGAIELPIAASKVSMQVFDAGGEQVADLSLGAMDAGVHPFEWDGKDADGRSLGAGSYTFRVAAATENEPIEVVSLAPATVTGLTRSANGYALQLESGALVGRESVRGVR